VRLERTLDRVEIARIWDIDRSEIVDHTYRLCAGVLVLERAHFDVRGWPSGEPEKYTPLFEACHDRGGWLYAIFEHDVVVGAAVLDAEFIAGHARQLQLVFLHVSRACRGTGLGRRLFACAADEARRRGARSLYVSATPSEHTIDFYLALGCRVASRPDPVLLALEPNDVHLEYPLAEDSLPGATRARNGVVSLAPVTDADARDLAAIRVAAMRESLERVARFDAARAAESFLAGFSPAHTRSIRIDRERVGLVVVRPTDDDLLLDHLYVVPAAQGAGVGAAVLGVVFAEADAAGKPLRVGALKESASNRFYVRHGFALERIAECDNYYVRHPHTQSSR
jgi:GNAT superfamily N-acetyltransferase